MSNTLNIKKILVTTDFSEFSHYAFRYAITLAEKFDAELNIVHVIQPTITPSDFAWSISFINSGTCPTFNALVLVCEK